MTEKLREVLSIQTVSHDQFRMFAYIVRQVKQIPNTVMFIDDGNLYITKGDAPTYPCMVAHMDTVHDITDDLFPLEFNGMITGFDRINMEQVGIGGDDKVGIFIALECLREFDDMKVAFFRDEEVGCMGSYGAQMSFFDDCRFVLQCDRRGNSDFIIDASGVELSSKCFQDDVLPIISSYGYKFAKGMMTDVMALKENQIEVSVANISCGYYNPHSPQEFVDVFDVMQCLEMCQTIIRYCTDTYTHRYKPRYVAPVAPYSKYGKHAKTNKFWDWGAPKQTSIFWEEEEIKKTPVVDTYCKDCWREQAVTVDGLCMQCESWYSDNMLW
jgi:hypothetical protein